MQVTLLIILSDAGYRARMIDAGPPARSWLRVYASKIQCMSELSHFHLITSEDAADAVLKDFDVRGAILVIQTNTDDATLTAAGFVPNPWVN